MKRILILVFVITLFLIGGANAAVKQGDTEIEFLGGWTNINFDDSVGGGDLDAWFLSGALGYFITDAIQISGAALGAWIETGLGDVDLYAVGAKGKYHFMTDRKHVPYVGAQILWGKAKLSGGAFDGDTDGTLWGPVVGLRCELNEYNDFFIEYQYHDYSGDAGDFLDDGHLVFLGLVHQFKN